MYDFISMHLLEKVSQWKQAMIDAQNYKDMMSMVSNSNWFLDKEYANMYKKYVEKNNEIVNLSKEIERLSGNKKQKADK